MNFQEQLAQQLASQNHGDREPVDYPSSKLKNKELYFPKAQQGQASSLLVRILPPAIAGENYNVQARELFLQTRNSNGKDLKLGAVLSPFPNQDDMLDVAITDWQAKNMVPNNFNRSAKPSNKYYVNAVQVVLNPQTNQYEEERDPQTGELAVRLFKLPFSACNLINTKLADPLFSPRELAQMPAEIAQYSFISSAYAFPIQLTKPPKGSNQMSYAVDIMTNLPLGALPQGWENQLEDLAYQATPSYQYNGEYVKYFIDVVNGVEPQQGQQQATQQQPQYQAPAYTQPQAPVQPTGQPQNIGTPVQGQTNMGTAPQLPPAQPQYQAPVNTMPVPPAPPVAPVVTDNVLPQDLVGAPDVASATQVVPPQTQTTTPPVSEAPVTTPPANTGGLPDVDDLLAGMKG